VIQSRLSLAKDATFFFQGGITTYNLGQKVKHLQIDPILAEKTNCVDEHLVRDMAINVSRLFNSAWGIGVTGYAVPVPALKIKQCFALYAFAYRGDVIFEARIDTKLKGALNVQLYYTSTILKRLAAHLSANYR
jgi:nicotinamide-nucleotide amidase